MPRLCDFSLTRLEVPLSRPIGDWTVETDSLCIGALELFDDTGAIGLGFFGFLPGLAGEERLNSAFRSDFTSSLLGWEPATALTSAHSRRGQHIDRRVFRDAIDVALWDLLSKQLGLPLHRVLGGEATTVPAYASGLDFPLSEVEARRFYAEAATRGYDVFKVKVGRETVAQDIERLTAVVDEIGTNATLLIDANEAWSAKEAMRRLERFREAGITPYWIEDPCLRDDLEGLRRVSAWSPTTALNAGEYLSFEGKLALVNSGAIDILNVGSNISESMILSHVVRARNLSMSIENTHLNIGAHLASAIPETTWVESQHLDWDVLVEEPLPIVDGRIELPQKPGHGLTLCSTARSAYHVPEPQSRD